jgi:hypothetical protein
MKQNGNIFSSVIFAQAETCGAKPAVAPAKQTVCGVMATMYKRLFKLSIIHFKNPERTYTICPNNHWNQKKWCPFSN